MANPQYLTHNGLAADGIAYGFFTRLGGVSQGLYASLNGGFGSGDNKAHVAENRRRAMQTLGLPRLTGIKQIHSPQAHRLTFADSDINDALTAPASKTGDGLVTGDVGLGLLILTADCAPVMLADTKHRIVAAAHAGWRGAAAGIIEATVATMCQAGATLASITAIVGPTIQHASYQVGEDMREVVLANDNDSDAKAETYFTPHNEGGKYLFDLPGYISHRLAKLGIAHYCVAADTYSDAGRFFSHRRRTHVGEADTGRLINIIGLTA